MSRIGSLPPDIGDQPTMELDVIDLRHDRDAAMDVVADDLGIDLRSKNHRVVDTVDPAPPRIDARFVVRRGDVRRRLRRRRRRILVTLAIVLLLVAATVGLSRSPMFSISRFDIRGNSRVTTDQVIAASALAKGDPLVGVDGGAVEDRLRALHWVARARVVRRWPQTIEITIVERTPVARVLAGVNAAVVAAGSVVIESGPIIDAATPAAELVPINVPADTALVVGRVLPGALADAVAFVTAMPSSLRPKLTDATVSDRGEVTASFGKCAEILLGTPDDAGAKFVAAETMLGGSVALDGLKRLDLRVPANPRLVRGGRCR